METPRRPSSRPDAVVARRINAADRGWNFHSKYAAMFGNAPKTKALSDFS